MLAEQNKIYAQITNGMVHWIFTSNELPEWNEQDIQIIDITNQNVEVGDTWDGVEFSKPDLSAINSALLISQALALLAVNDFRWNNSIRWSSYSKEQKQALTTYYNALVAVVHGESSTLPILEN